MKCVESVKISSYETIFYLDLQDLTYFPSLILTSVLVAVEENLANLCYFMSFPLGNSSFQFIIRFKSNLFNTPQAINETPHGVIRTLGNAANSKKMEKTLNPVNQGRKSPHRC